jgi:hypothetical protein
MLQVTILVMVKPKDTVKEFSINLNITKINSTKYFALVAEDVLEVVVLELI